jgi:16S rRNA processing protein RimM
VQSGRVRLGRIVKTQGLRGEVRINPFSGDPALLTQVEALDIEGEGSFRVQTARVHKRIAVIKFDGVDSVERAQSLVGREATALREALPAPEEEEFYWHDLVGCGVHDRAEGDVGEVTSVFESGAHATLVVSRPGGKDFYVPFVEAIVTEVDLEGKRLQVDLPPGLMDV